MCFVCVCVSVCVCVCLYASVCMSCVCVNSQTDVIISTITIQSQKYHLPQTMVKTMVTKQPIYAARAIHNTHNILRNLCYITPSLSS